MNFRGGRAKVLLPPFAERLRHDVLNGRVLQIGRFPMSGEPLELNEYEVGRPPSVLLVVDKAVPEVSVGWETPATLTCRHRAVEPGHVVLSRELLRPREEQLVERIRRHLADRPPDDEGFDQAQAFVQFVI